MELMSSGAPRHKVPALELARARAYVAITCAVLGSLCLVWFARNIFLLFFAAILFGTVLNKVAGWISRKTRLGHGLSLTVTILAMLGLTVGALFLLAPEVSQQVDQMTERLPQAVTELRGRVEQVPWAKRALSSILNSKESGKAAVVALPSLLWGTSEVLGAFLFVFFGGLFLAAQPKFYRNGFLRLLPPARREDARECLDGMGDHLANWVLAQLILMVTVGALTVIGLSVLKLPMALSLGLLTGVLIFIPYTGSIASAVPAILVAMLESFSKVLWVIGIYIAAHHVEAYIVGPVVQRKVVKLPPAINLGFQVLMGFLAGIPGIALASPLLLVIWTLVEKLYLEKREPADLYLSTNSATISANASGVSSKGK